MISFQAVTKRYPDGTTAASNLDLEVAPGEVCVLVGPSGCGKTTSLRMINRMIEPTSGAIEVEGEDIANVDPARLRRRMGYVIQQTGLFPHRTVGQNIGTVPKLVGWDKKRIAARVSELIELVGLPGQIADRYPHQLSGGQQQRVGVARALAVDPPIMLMDEPFAATDPITRERLQDEFLRLQREVRKTIVFVTHDIDEAIKMGDRIAILRQGGLLVQYDTPERLLSNPADVFVADFLGKDRGLKRLALVLVSELQAEPGPVVHAGDGFAHTSAVATAHGTDWVVVLGDAGELRGWTRLDGTAPDVEGVRPFGAEVGPQDSIRTVLNAMITSTDGLVALVDADGRYEGLLSQEDINRQLGGLAAPA